MSSFILYLLGLARFFTIAAAMDTASPFEGMGAAREAYFPIICEASMFMILILFYRLTGDLNLAAYFSGTQPFGFWQTAGSPMLLWLSPFSSSCSRKMPACRWTIRPPTWN
jgi:NADH:ubiquinone oxidoreductase subunit H